MPNLAMSAFRVRADLANKQRNSAEATLTLGDTGLIKIGVVGPGKLQRYEARENQTGGRGKVFKVQGGAGGGELPRH